MLSTATVPVQIQANIHSATERNVKNTFNRKKITNQKPSSEYPKDQHLLLWKCKIQKPRVCLVKVPHILHSAIELCRHIKQMQQCSI